jgi:hypothetical protein
MDMDISRAAHVWNSEMGTRGNQRYDAESLDELTSDQPDKTRIESEDF